MSYALFPKPRRAAFRRQVLDFTKAQWVTVDPRASDALKGHALAFAEEVGDAFARPLEVTSGEPRQGQTLLSLMLLPERGKPQGYELTAGRQRITLTARDEAGAFYGLQTMTQLIRQTGAHVPAFEIADEPDFAHRGLMLDISRCKVPTMETLVGIVDLMAVLKLNELQLYTEHTFAYSEHETVWHDASPMTPSEMLALDAYCREHYVELVPNQNSFGHFERWLRHPEYRHLAECPDGFEYPWGGRTRHGSVLKPNRDSLRFLDTLYQELLANFASGSFNVGCDETWELGKGWSKALCERKGTVRVYLDFLLGIHRLVRRHDRTMMFWGDIILHQPDLMRELPEDIVALEWGYDADHPFARHCPLFGKAGVPFYVCPGTSSWNSLTGRTPNCFANLASAARNGRRHGALGYLITDWGDGGHHQYWPISYPGILAGAALSWCAQSNADPDVAAALDDLVFHDEAGRLGSCLVGLGRVYELASKKPGNATIFNELLFHDVGTKYLLEGLTAASLRKCVARFDELSAEIGASRPLAGDGALVKAELLNAIAMARAGAERGLAGLVPRNHDRAQLRHALQHVISRHEELWLARNRPGGLNESSAPLRAQLKQLE
jgi:hypothetical protein